MNRYLLLENGFIFSGKAIGADLNGVVGEIVFNTAMTGYQEAISDPSYCGQFVVMTYPLIGNYGINREDFESIQPYLNGLIVKECAKHPSNFRSEYSLDQFLKQKNIPGIAGIDTRRLVRIIREHGTLMGMLTDSKENNEDNINYLNHTKLPTNQVERVSIAKPYVVPGWGERIVLVDLGMKHGILRELTKRGCHVMVVPFNTTANEILQLQPDGVMLSNGPGNPKDVPEAVEMVKSLFGKVPVFGICLGHQIIALASGAETIKMKFGHRGGNHPVKDLRTNKVWITSQNHSFTVEEKSLNHTGLIKTQVSLNDGSIEGLEHEKYNVFSVQYHPESSPGPHDSNKIFDEFLLRIRHEKEGGVKKCQNEQTYIKF